MTASVNLHHTAMLLACRRALTGLGLTGRNPSVGCVAVYHNRIIAATRTANTGRPHSEYIMLEQLANIAHDDRHNITLYVTLEPCLHDGETPSCARLIAEFGIKNIVVADYDSDKRTSGKLQEFCKNHDLNITYYRHDDIVALTDELYQGFHLRNKENRPFISAKSASSLDGRIALHNQQSQWITGDIARQYGQYLRKTHDAIVIGANSFYHDNPRLNVRLYPIDATAQPLRIILLNDAYDAKMVQDNIHQAWDIGQKTWLVLPTENTQLNADHILISDTYDPSILLGLCADDGINRLLIEGGGGIIANFLKYHLLDRLYHITAPMVIGGDGVANIGALGYQSLQDAFLWHCLETRMLGQDRLSIYDKL